jgi:hypothetical protein
VGIESTVVRVEESAGGDAVVSLTILRRGGLPSAALRAALDASGLSDVAINFAARLVSTAAAGEERGHDDNIGLPAPGMLLTHYAPDLAAFMLRITYGEGGSSETGRLSAAVGVAATATAAAVVAAEDTAAVTAPMVPADTTRDSSGNGLHELGDLTTTVILDYGDQVPRAMRAAAMAVRELTVPSDREATLLPPAAAAARALFSSLRWAESVPGATRVLLLDPRTVDSSDEAEAVRDRLWRAASGKEIVLHSHSKANALG